MIPHDVCFYCVLMGVLLCLAAQEAWAGFKHWRRVIATERRRALRCEVDEECVSPRNHRGSCEVISYE